MEMFPPNKLAIAHEEHLHNRITLILRHRDNIPIFHALARNLLLLRHLSDTVKQIPVLNRLLKLHRLGRRPHLFFQIFHDRLILSI